MRKISSYKNDPFPLLFNDPFKILSSTRILLFFLYRGRYIWPMFQQKHPSIFFLYLEFCWTCFCPTDLHTSCYPRGLFIFLIFLLWPNANTDSLKHRNIYNNTFQTESKTAGQPNFVDLTLLKMDMFMVFHFNAIACHVFDCLPLVCNSSYSMVNVSYFT